MSKTLLVLIVGMLAVGCASTPTMKSVVTPTMKSVAGTYEPPFRTLHDKMVLLDNGVLEVYTNGKPEAGVKWKIVDGDIHAGLTAYGVAVIRVNKDDSITLIAIIDGAGKREDIPKDEQYTLRKTK